MKAKILILTILAMSVVFQLSAKVWRVNNRTILTQTVTADFTTIQAAITGASAGDTIYVEGSAVAYGAGIVDKPLVIIGTGYFLTVNDTTQAYNQDSQVGTLTFNPGSEGSVAMGLRIYVASNTTDPTKAIVVNTDSITIKKNYLKTFDYHALNAYEQAITISVAAGVQDIVISQNYIIASMNNFAGLISCGIFINAGAECYINNNIFYIGAPFYRHAIITENSVSNVISINNNVFVGLQIETYYTALLNNIMSGGTYNIGTADYSANNLCSSTQFPAGNNNLQNVDMSTVFVDHTTGADSGLMLKAASPAIGAGINGGDCGVFSNETGYPYVLSGMPEIPAIFEFSTGFTIGIDTIPVTLKAISHNEGR